MKTSGTVSIWSIFKRLVYLPWCKQQSLNLKLFGTERRLKIWSRNWNTLSKGKTSLCNKGTSSGRLWILGTLSPSSSWRVDYITVNCVLFMLIVLCYRSISLHHTGLIDRVSKLDSLHNAATKEIQNAAGAEQNRQCQGMANMDKNHHYYLIISRIWCFIEFGNQ